MRARLALIVLLAANGCALIDGIGGDGDDGNPDEPDVPKTDIAELRAQGPQSTDVLLVDVMLTYRTPEGFFLQDDPEGPGIFVNEGSAPGIDVGNEVTLEVFDVSLVGENLQITESFVVEHTFSFTPAELEDAFASPIDVLDQSPGPAHNGRLIRLTGARTETEINPGNFSLSSASNLNWFGDLFSPVAFDVGLCVGSTFDLVAVVQLFDQRFQIEAFKPEDFRRLQNNCNLPPNP